MELTIYIETHSQKEAEELAIDKANVGGINWRFLET